MHCNLSGIFYETVSGNGTIGLKSRIVLRYNILSLEKLLIPHLPGSEEISMRT